MNSFSNKPAWKELYLPLSVIVVATLAVYSNALGNGFVFDDNDQILGNPWIKNVRFLPEIFTSNVWGFKTGPDGVSNYYRPMMYVLYILAYLCSGLKPWSYHLLSILLHTGSSVLVFLISSILFKKYESPPKYLSMPLIAGVIFAVHPIHTEAVAWAAGIPDLSFTFFCLLSLYLYIRSEDRFSAGYYFSVAAFFVAALCKEPALTLPVLLLAYDLLSGRKIWGDKAFLIKRFAPFFLAALAYIGLRAFALSGSMVPQGASHSERGLGDLLVVIETYVKKLVVPVNPKFLYSFAPVSSLSDPPAIAAALLVVLVIAVLFTAFRKDRLMFFCLLVIGVPLMPCLYLNAIRGPSLIAERYLYLPSAGYSMLVASAITRAANSRRRVIAATVLFTLVLLFSLGTIYRNTDWKDDYSFWSDTVKKSPGSPFAHDNLGLVYAKRGQGDLAQREFSEALIGYPIAVNAYRHLGVLYGKQGKVDEAITVFQEALKVMPGDPDTHNELGIQYVNRGELNLAEEQFREAIRLNPSNTMFRGNLEKALREIEMGRSGGR